MKRDEYRLELVTDTLFKKHPARQIKLGRFGQMRLAMCTAATAAVLVGAALMVPSSADDVTPDTATAALSVETPPAPMADKPIATLQRVVEVTRSDTVLLDLPKTTAKPVRAGVLLSNEPISHQLRQPVRLSNRSGYAYSLNALVTATLGQFGADSPKGGPLNALLLQTLAQGVTDDAIILALDTALARGDFEVPEALRTVAGGLDTPALLAAMVAMRLGQPVQITASLPANGLHELDAGDSLAGLALKYYGQPTRFDVIAQRNHKALTQAGGIAAGSALIIPSL